MSSEKEGWLVAALDAISQFRATKEPLKNVVKRLGAQRKLGPRERSRMSNAVFAWSRVAHQSDAVVLKLKEAGINRPSHRQVDEAIITEWLSGESDSVQTFPEWFVSKLQHAYGDEVPSLLESLQQRAGPTLAFDPRHTNKAEICAALDEAKIEHANWKHLDDAIAIRSPKFRLTSLPEPIQQHIWIMDGGSQLIADLALPKDGKKILDACAGGGGKTQFLLSRGARVTAMDISERRLDDAKKRCRNERVHFVVGDAINPPFEPHSFDHILIDAPCSGTGTLRRAPDLLLRVSENEIESYVALQRKILMAMASVLRPRGTLIYATCSILPEENHAQANWATQKLGLTLVSEQQLLPSLDDSDGFYVAKFVMPA